MIGDGCLSKYFASYERRVLYVTLLTGNSLKENEYQLYLSNILSKLFDVNCKPRIRRNSSNTTILQTSTKRVFDWFIENGFPVGKKDGIVIPKKLLGLPKNKLNKIIRGIFDTDGCISARKDENYRYPYIFISSSSIVLREQIKDILRQQKIPAYVHKDTVVVRGIKNFNKWFELIGSSNLRNLKRYKEFQTSGRLLSVGL